MSGQDLIAVAVVGAAGAYLVRTVYRAIRGRSGCACGETTARGCGSRNANRVTRLPFVPASSLTREGDDKSQPPGGAADS